MQNQQINGEKYVLLSINKVSKKLKIGYTKAKKLVELGIIKSVPVIGKLMVPLCKLEEFIHQNYMNEHGKDTNTFPDDEAEALTIIENLNKLN